MRTRLSRLLLPGLCLAGCVPDFAITELKVDTDLPEFVGVPALEVEPPSIDFGYVPEGTTVDGIFSVTNLGDGPLELLDVVLAGDADFSSDAVDVVLEPEEQVDLLVTYTSSASDASAAITLATNDLIYPTLELPVTGTGADAQLVGADLDFGYVLVGTDAVATLPLSNPGNVAVTLTALSSSDGHFVVSLPAPVTVDAASATSVEVTFSPEDLIAYTGTLALQSDAREPTGDLETRGHGADVPVAVCAGDPPVVTAIHETFNFLGAGSSDPLGRPLTAQWSLVSIPTGSAFLLGPANTRDIGPYEADVVGDYVTELVVTNDIGFSSEPCQATVSAEPNADLWVELFWEHADDFDLHLVRGNAPMRGAGDCYFANCQNGLSWGGAGQADDPFLDLDDITGLGPENINIAAPAPNTYRVVVHDFPGRTYRQANQFTVKIYLEGALVLEEVRSVTGENSETDVAVIDLNAQPPTVTPL